MEENNEIHYTTVEGIQGDNITVNETIYDTNTFYGRVQDMYNFTFNNDGLSYATTMKVCQNIKIEDIYGHEHKIAYDDKFVIRSHGSTVFLEGANDEMIPIYENSELGNKLAGLKQKIMVLNPDDPIQLMLQKEMRKLMEEQGLM